MAAPAAAGIAASAAGSGSGSAVGASIGSAAVSGGMSIFSSLMNNLFNRHNINDQNAYNERLMRESWARDDTAYQRMVQDLENAGLSKWLAAGKSAMSSDPVRMEAVQDDFGGFADAGKHAIDAYNATMQTSLARNADVRAQETHANEMDLFQAQKDKLEAEARKANAEADQARHDADIWVSRPDVASNDPTGLRYIAEAIKTLKGDSSSFNFTKSPAVKARENGIQSKLDNGQTVTVGDVRDFLDTAFGKGFTSGMSDSEINDIITELYKDQNMKALKKLKGTSSYEYALDDDLQDLYIPYPGYDYRVGNRYNK